MVARAEAKYIRISPFKIRPVILLVKGERAEKALALLKMTYKKGAFLLRKVVQSAVANAKNKGYELDTLFLSNVIINEGPILKRFRAASFGRATKVRKRTSHIIVELDAKEKLVETPEKKVANRKVNKGK